MPYDLDAIRKKIKESQSGKRADPDEFRPEKANSATEPRLYRFFILPPIELGDHIKGGAAKKSMDNQFYVTHGNHWVSEKPHPCPRVWSDDDCPMCKFGFDLLKDDKIKNDDILRRKTVSTWMPNQQYAMNIFFPAVKQNPEDLHNRVMYYNAPKTVLDICTTALYRDDAGDPESPEAYGAFFDENNAFLFELQILKQGKQNSYKTSKFLSTPRPMARNEDGSPNQAALTKILASRIDLFSKIEAPDLAKLGRVFQVLSNGDDSYMDKKTGGFDEDEAKSSQPAGKRDTGTTQTSKSTTTTRKPPVDDDDDVVTMTKSVESKQAAKSEAPAKDTLADEAPLPEKSKDAAKPSQKPENNPDIDNLLSQLDDDD